MAKDDPALAAEGFGLPSDQRAIHLSPYLNRTVPYWRHPGYYEGRQWRSVVLNQPIAIICRDTLISNMLSRDWAVRLREPEDTELDATKKEIDRYTKILTEADGDFDDHISMVMQDMLDLPFGGISEIGRDPDEPDGEVQWLEHVDGATCVPTGDQHWPVVQAIPEVPERTVVFPRHAISRSYMNPSPSIWRKGWGMAPPEKIYLAMQMLYRGDRYYANLLLDTPEAGILDLGDMSQEAASEWLEGFQSLFSGIDGFKVPVLYEHTTPAQWIPFNRPPTDMLYDETTMKYGAMVCAGYGMRMSDIGMAEIGGEKTLAGVIRGERQTRRTGQAEVGSRLENYFNRMLPDHLAFIWEDKDEEVKRATATAISTIGLALGQMKRDALLSPEETRAELAAFGLLEVDIDPAKVPEEVMPMMGPGMGGGLFGQQKEGPGKPGDKDRGKTSKDKEARGKVSAADGGRGGPTARHIVDRAFPPEGNIVHPTPQNKYDSLVVRMTNVVKPGMSDLPNLAMLTGTRSTAASTPSDDPPRSPRLRRLIKAVLPTMIEQARPVFKKMDDDAIQRYWLPEMNALDFDAPSELEGLVTRASVNELRELLEKHLEDDLWWRIASAWEKAEMLDIFKEAYELGLEDAAIDIVRALYEEGLFAAPLITPEISFNLSSKAILKSLETSAALLVTQVNAGTKYFIKRIIVAAVRQGISQGPMAAAIRDGVAAEELLRRAGFAESIIKEIVGGMIEMSEARSLSIVHTELNRATNAGALKQQARTGLKLKSWVHFGTRGITEAGNEHPCPFCKANEELGFVPNDFLYETVFKSGGPENDGRSLHAPAHPNVCHCGVSFSEEELFETVAKGEYAPYLGGR